MPNVIHFDYPIFNSSPSVCFIGNPEIAREELHIGVIFKKCVISFFQIVRAPRLTSMTAGLCSCGCSHTRSRSRPRRALRCSLGFRH